MVTALKVKFGAHIFSERKKRNISQVIDLAVLLSIEKNIFNRSIVKSTVDETHASNIRSRHSTLQVENVPEDLFFSSAPKPSQDDDKMVPHSCTSGSTFHLTFSTKRISDLI